MALWLHPGDDLWSSALRTVEHDVYHFPCYAQVATWSESGEARAYYDEVGNRRILIPLIVRDVASADQPLRELLDAVSPYGYASPLFSDGMRGSDVEEGLQRFIDFGRDTGLVTTLLRLHPLLSRHVIPAVACHEGAEVVIHGATLSIDLSLDTAALNRQLRGSHRREVRKLIEMGFKTTLDQWDHFSAFQKLYQQAMKRLGAPAHYDFDEEYFRQLRSCFGPSLHLGCVISPDGGLACGGLFTLAGGIVQYHLSATAPRYRSVSPSKLMLYEMRNWGKRSGARVFHLGGGVGVKKDSLYQFKRGFASDEHPFETVRIVHDRQTYEALTARWLEAHKLDSFPDARFFPLYRSPLPS